MEPIYGKDFKIDYLGHDPEKNSFGHQSENCKIKRGWLGNNLE